MTDKDSINSPDASKMYEDSLQSTNSKNTGNDTNYYIWPNLETVVYVSNQTKK